MAQRVKDPPIVSAVQSLALLMVPGLAHGLRLWCCCGCGWGVGHIHSLDPALPWVWHRLEAAAPIRPLAWEPPYASGAALKRK